MTPLEKTEFEQMKRDIAVMKQAITVDANTIVLQKPVVIRGPLNLNGITIFTGTGNPDGVVTANVGSVFLRLDSGFANLYMKEIGTGNTGWNDVT